jgi:hypothetical protein
MKIARMIVTDGFSFTPAQATIALLTFLAKLDGKVDWITASGCFLGGKFPLNPDLQVGWNSSSKDAALVYSYGDKLVDEMMTPELKEALKDKTKYFSFGIDLKERDAVKLGMHAELVSVWDSQLECVTQHTGKTYPCADQENSMYHTVDYNTHFMEVCGERVMILGCNDLNMYYARGIKALTKKGTPRYKRNYGFRKAAKKFDPTVVLQHPHFSDTHDIWYVKWCNLRGMLKNVKSFSSAICYGRWPHKNKPAEPIRGSLADVVSKSHGGSIDTDKSIGQSLWPIQDVYVSHHELNMRKAA